MINMKGLMITINLVLVLGSAFGILWHLIMGQFGIAWLCVLPLLYGWFNCVAIDEE